MDQTKDPVDPLQPAVEPVSVNQLATENADTTSALDQIVNELGIDTSVVNEDPVPSDQSVDEAPTAEPVEEVPAAEPATETPEPVAEEKPASRLPEVPAVDGEQPKEAAPATPPADDPYEQVKLRADASPKTRESFEGLKKLGREREAAIRAEVERVRKEYEAKLAETKPSTEVPEDLQKELEELRSFRATFQIENDPQFRARFDAKKNETYESIYGILRSQGLPESEEKVLKDLPESERVTEISKLLPHLAAPLKMRIEAKLLQTLNVDEERQQVLEEARAKASQLLKAQSEAPVKQQEQVKQALNSATERFTTSPIFKTVDIPANTPAEEKKRLEAANQHAAKLSKLFQEAVFDDTPTARAENAFGLALAHHLKAQNAALEAQLAVRDKEIAAIRKASSTARVGAVVNVPTTKVHTASVELDSGSALDALARESGFLR